MRRWELADRELRLIGEEGTTSPAAEDIYAALVDGDAVWEDVPKGRTGDAASLRFSRYPLQPNLILHLPSGSTLPVLELRGKAGGTAVDLELGELERAHVVIEGTWHPIEQGASADILALLKSHGWGLGPVGSLQAFMALRAAAMTDMAIEDRMGGTVIPPMAFVPPVAEAPAGVKAKLYPYQSDGWRWLRFLLSEGLGGLLADEMGLGKTLQVISAISDLGLEERGQALICAPGSLLENWRRELARFAPDLRVLKHHGPLRTGRPADLKTYDVVITSYDSAVRDNSLLQMVDWNVMVLDEAQHIRNPHAQRTRAIKRLPRKSGLAVTGTPVENRLMDLWSIMDFVAPGYLGDESAFNTTYSDDAEGAALLEPMVSPLMLRRRVAEVATDLPARIDIPQVIELEASEAAAYDDVRSGIAEKYGAAATLVALTALRQFCAHPMLLDEHPARGDPMSFSKFRRLDELLEEIFARREKVIIFTSYTAMADMIVGHVAKAHGAFAAAIDGRLAIDDRQPMIDRFSNVQNAATLVLNPKAGGAGLNITAANHVIHYNLEWNPALEDQASARAYRRGQTLPVTVHRLFVGGSVEEVVDERLARKREVAGTAVVGIEGRDEDYGDIVAALNRSPLDRGPAR